VSFPLVIPGRRAAANPESMNTALTNKLPPVFMDSGLAGFDRDPE
jgi:hypothetical protein